MSVVENIYQNGFHIIDNFLDEAHYQELRSLVQLLHDQGNFEPAKIGQQQNKVLNTTVRSDHIFWLDKEKTNPAIEAYFAGLKNISTALNESLFLGLVDYEAHFAIYQPNNFYKKHVDQFATAQERRISCVYYLNPSWQEAFGGQLQLYDHTDQPLTTILPQGNRFVCFNSDIPHEVRTAFKTRYSIAAWLKIRSMTHVI